MRVEENPKAQKNERTMATFYSCFCHFQLQCRNREGDGLLSVSLFSSCGAGNQEIQLLLKFIPVPVGAKVRNQGLTAIAQQLKFIPGLTDC